MILGSQHEGVAKLQSERACRRTRSAVELPGSGQVGRVQWLRRLMRPPSICGAERIGSQAAGTPPKSRASAAFSTPLLKSCWERCRRHGNSTMVLNAAITFAKQQSACQQRNGQAAARQSCDTRQMSASEHIRQHIRRNRHRGGPGRTAVGRTAGGSRHDCRHRRAASVRGDLCQHRMHSDQDARGQRGGRSPGPAGRGIRCADRRHHFCRHEQREGAQGQDSRHLA